MITERNEELENDVTQPKLEDSKKMSVWDAVFAIGRALSYLLIFGLWLFYLVQCYRVGHADTWNPQEAFRNFVFLFILTSSLFAWGR